MKPQPFARTGLMGLASVTGARTLAFRNRGELEANGSLRQWTTLEVYDDRFVLGEVKTLPFQTLLAIGAGDGTFLFGESSDGKHRIGFVDAAGTLSESSVEVDRREYGAGSFFYRMGTSAVLASSPNPRAASLVVTRELAVRPAPWVGAELDVSAMRCRDEGCLLALGRGGGVSVVLMSPDLSLGPETKVIDAPGSSSSAGCSFAAVSHGGAPWCASVCGVALLALARRRRLCREGGALRRRGRGTQARGRSLRA